MRRISLVLVPLVLLLAGCFEIEQSIELKKDMSGTADFHLGVDLEPMVMIMAQMQKEMAGKKGPLTEAELAAAKLEFKKSSTSKKSDEKMPTLKELQKDMPEGVKLLDFKAEEREFGMDTRFKFGFDKVGRLVNVKLPQSKDGEQDPTKKSVIDSPFEGLEVVDEGKTFTIRTKPQNPTESVKEQAADGPKLDKDTEKMMKDAFGKLRVAYKITAPFEVVSHNADRKEGNTLIWEYDYKKFEALSNEKNKKKLDDVAVRVTYRK